MGSEWVSSTAFIHITIEDPDVLDTNTAAQVYATIADGVTETGATDGVYLGMMPRSYWLVTTITENPTPWPTVAPIHTSTPQPDDTNTPTIEPSATDEATITPPALVTVTDGPLQSPLATPVPEETETPAP